VGVAVLVRNTYFLSFFNVPACLPFLLSFHFSLLLPFLAYFPYFEKIKVGL
jgi:hypothetical protein